MKEITKFRFLLFLFSLLTFGLKAQFPHVRPIEIDKSLQDIKVEVIIQDQQKLMWLGTNKGLYNYDGSVFKLTPTLKNTGEIIVTALFCDTKGTIWVGLKRGTILRYQNDSLKLFDIDEGLPKEQITGITEDNNGHIWFATYGEGLYVWDGKHLYNINNNDDHLADDYVYCILTDNKGRTWSGTDGGISLCTFNNGKKQIKNYTTKEGLTDNIIKRLIWDKRGFLWFGTDNYGIGKLYPDNNKIEIPSEFSNWNQGAIESMLLMEREIWIGTNSSGLIDYEFTEKKRTRKFLGAAGFNYPSIQCLFRDDEGNIWIACKDQLLQSPGERMEFLKTIEGKPVVNIHATLIDSKKRLWFSDDEGLHRVIFNADGTEQSKSFSFSELKIPYKILTIFQDAFGFIWFGTFDQGIFRMDPETGQSIHINDNKDLLKQSVLSISGKRSTLWLATLSGAVKMELGDDALQLKCGIQIDYYNSTNGLNNNFIYQVLLDRKGRIWFAQDGKGISMMNKDGFHHFGEKDSIKAKTFFSITEDRNGGLWFASTDNGLYRYKTDETKVEKFFNYNLSNGLPSLHITGLCADNIGNVIIVCLEGIAMYNLDKESFNWFQKAEGIETVDADLNTTSLSPDGVVWVGARNQLIEINTSLDKFRKTPFLTFEKATALLDLIDLNQYAKIPVSKNHLAFSYQGIWFSNPSEVYFQYKMEGLNREWINTRDKTATFPDLKPGRYTFRLRCSRTNDFSHSNEINYSFVILYPIYQQWWFVTFSIIGLIALTWMFLKIRDQRVNFVQRLEKEKLASQFETLKNQVNPHFLFNSFNTLANIIDDDKTKAIEYIEKLTDFFRQILVHREKDLIKLEEELEIINDYVYLQQQRFETALKINISISKEQSQTLFIPPLALQILVENVIKHNSMTAQHPLIIELYFENGFFVIKNNLQPKLNKESSTGTGLQNITRRMQMLGLPAIEVENTGTHFIVKFKLADKK